MIDRLESLERLGRLHQSGVLSDEEFAAEKKRILSGGGAPEEQAAAPVAAAPAAPEDAREAAAAAEPRGEPAGAPAIWLRRNRRPLGAAAAAALLFGGYFAYATVQDLQEASAKGAGRSKSGRAAPAASAGKDEDGAADVARGGATGGRGEEIAWIAFEEAKSCSPGPELRAVAEDMWGREAASGSAVRATMRLPGGGEPAALQVQRVAVENARTAPVAAQVAVVGAWRGLGVTGIRTVAWPGSEVRSLQIRFADPPAAVRRALGEAGFELAEVGEQRSTASGERSVAIGVEAIAGGAALTCVRG
ncbi:MAG TPA: SHOCT domain-containing protein [Allosphingosinicella sp.]|jgi:hypothetical protein